MHDHLSSFFTSFSKRLSTLGFNWNGMQYSKENDDFLFILDLYVYHDGKFSSVFGIQPKIISHMGTFGPHNFAQMSPVDFELINYFIPDDLDPPIVLQSSDKENENLADHIFTLFQQQIVPDFDLFKGRPCPFDEILISDLEHPNLIQRHFGNVVPMTTTLRKCWMLSLYHEIENPGKAREFASYGLKIIEGKIYSEGDPDSLITFEQLARSSYSYKSLLPESFFGLEDLIRIAYLPNSQ